MYRPYSARRGFQSTLPARGATVEIQTLLEKEFVSIHAPREGSDHPCHKGENNHIKVSIHAPREGSDATAPHIGTRS